MPNLIEYGRRDGIEFWFDSKLLQAGLVHAFLGRSVDFRQRPAATAAVCAAFGAANLSLLKQTHSTICHQRSAGWPNVPEGDGWTIEISGEISGSSAKPPLYGVLTADCLPVIVWVDSSAGNSGPAQCAVLHCGWRGAVGGLLEQTLQKLDPAGSAKTTVVIGPGASGCCFEIGAEVLDQFETARNRCRKNGGPSNNESAIVIKRDGKFFAEIKSLLVNQARAFGVSPSNIRVSPVCTICDTRFFSFRREKEAAGRQLTFIAGTLLKAPVFPGS